MTRMTAETRMVLGVDPGPTETAYCIIDDNYRIQCAVKLPNGEAVVYLRNGLDYSHVAVEGMRGMGKAVGHETFEAAYIVGRVQEIGERKGVRVAIYHRPDYLYPLCGGRPLKGKSDATLYTALKTRFGADNLKQLKGATDLRSAFAVAVHHLDKLKGGGE